MLGPIKLKIQKDTFQIGTFRPPSVLPIDYEEKLVLLRTKLSKCESISESIKMTKFESRKPIPVSEVLKLAIEGDNFALSHLAKFLFYETKIEEEKRLAKVIMHTLAYGIVSKVSVFKAYDYGKMLLNENRIEEALECFSQLEGIGFAPAFATVGRIHYSSPFVKKDEKLAEEKWKKASELGHFIASLWLARLKIRQQSNYKKPLAYLNYAKVFIVGVLKSPAKSDRDAHISILV